MTRILLPMLLSLPLLAQTGRTVSLTWTDSVNPAATKYNVYKASGECTGTPTFTVLNATPLTPKAYDDAGVAPGVYCYRVTASLPPLPESEPSDGLRVLVPLAKPGTPAANVVVAFDLQFKMSPDGKRVQVALAQRTP